MRCGEWDRREEGEHLGELRERRKHLLRTKEDSKKCTDMERETFRFYKML
jgi:hypothetical protein